MVVPSPQISEEKMQEKYMEFSSLQQQIEQISQHTELLHQQNQELDISRHALEELGKTDTNTEILAPIADGIFIKTVLKDNQKLLVNVGSNTTVERTVPEAIALLNGQKSEIQERLQEAESILQQLQAQAMKMYQEIEGKS